MSRTFLPHVITDDSSLGGMVIERSLRFRSSHYLSRTPSGAGSNQMTFSFWVKRGALGSSQTVFSSGENNARAHIYFGSDDKLNCQPFNSSGANTNLVVDRLLRDTNSWYHIVLSFNNSAYNDTASTVNVYINGVSASFTPSVTNTPTGGNRLNDSSGKRIGEMRPDSGNHLNGYLAEFNFIDGQVLDPSYFGFTDTQTGIWMPKRYEGTYGTNGFHLDFNDNSSVAALGIDKSPNGNDWSVSGVEIDLGTHDDSMIDTPTNNFPTLNTFNRSSGPTLDWGNLYFFYNYKPATKTARSTFRLPKSGKYYWEWENNEASSNPGRWQSTIGNVEELSDNSFDVNAANNANFVSYSYGGSTWNGTTHVSASWDGTTRSWYRPQRAAWAVDCDTGNIFLGRVADDATTQWWASDGSATGNPSKLLNPTCAIDKDKTHEYAPIVCWHEGGAGSSTGFAIDINFGQHAFKGTVPDGFKTLSSANISPDPTTSLITRPQRHFDTLLYTGDGQNNRKVTGLEYKPDFMIIKRRDTTGDYGVYDSVRGPTKRIITNSETPNETTVPLGSFDDGGFTFSTDMTYNTNSATYIAWCWKGGGTAVANNDGNVTSQVSANVEAGFSVVTYQGTGNEGITIGHGLGVAPEMVLYKSRDESAAWRLYTTVIDGSNDYIPVVFNGAKVNSGIAAPDNLVWRSGSADTNGENMVIYCFRSVEGYSKFGSYVGGTSGGANGNFVYCGFRPAWVLIKNISNDNWVIFDNKRDIDNPLVDRRFPDGNLGDDGISDQDHLDFLDNGFRSVVSGGGNLVSGSGSTYIFWAFAEQPGFTNSNTFPNAR